MRDLNFLNSHKNVKKGKLASIGFCWGGARSFKLATEPNDLKAAVVFYGTAPTDEELAKIHCPVFGNLRRKRRAHHFESAGSR